jgi:Response regulators consisting of a CheY-like receiver domain and a winged-helix DNA-binding domain
MKKIALIEDDADLYALLKYNLEKEGFTLVGSQTGKGALELCRRERPDLILLDIMLPDSDGLDICKGIRSHSELAHIPVIFLTARASETDRILGLELGANDYIVKPFFIRELIARIKIQFRGLSTPARVLKSGRLELDRTSCRVKLAGETLSLTATEFRLLDFLMSRPAWCSAGNSCWTRSGARSRCDGPHRGCLYSPAAAEDGDRSGQPNPDPLGARLRLQLQ